jgi:hypothetical protein
MAADLLDFLAAMSKAAGMLVLVYFLVPFLVLGFFLVPWP